MEYVGINMGIQVPLLVIDRRGVSVMTTHYYRMLLRRHYDQRPFNETVCDALIANGDVKKCQKRCKTFAMNDTSNMVQILVACVMRGIRLIHMNYLR
jgi:hypothetical protein